MTTSNDLMTAQQLLNSPDIGPCELIRGELVMMTPASYEHSRIVSRIDRRLGVFVEERGLGEVLSGEGGFQIAHGPDTVRAADVAFVSKERVPDETARVVFFQGAPDLAVEVVSPNDRASEVLAKAHDWLAAGCRAVWIVDPATRTVSVHVTGREIMVLGPSDTLEGGDVLPGLRVPVAEVFRR